MMYSICVVESGRLSDAVGCPMRSEKAITVSLDLAERGVIPRDSVSQSSEISLQCGTCGACCLRVFDALDVDGDHAFQLRYPSLISVAFGHLQLAGRKGRCPLLVGDGSDVRPYRCSDYLARPTTCRTFREGSTACQQARTMMERSSRGATSDR